MGVARVVQQGHQELPELQGTSALVGRSLAEDASALLLHLTWGGERREPVAPDAEAAHASVGWGRSAGVLVFFTGHWIRGTHVWEPEKLS